MNTEVTSSNGRPRADVKEVIKFGSEVFTYLFVVWIMERVAGASCVYVIISL